MFTCISLAFHLCVLLSLISNASETPVVCQSSHYDKHHILHTEKTWKHRCDCCIAESLYPKSGERMREMEESEINRREGSKFVEEGGWIYTRKSCLPKMNQCCRQPWYPMQTDPTLPTQKNQPFDHLYKPTRTMTHRGFNSYRCSSFVSPLWCFWRLAYHSSECFIEGRYSLGRLVDHSRLPMSCGLFEYSSRLSKSFQTKGFLPWHNLAPFITPSVVTSCCICVVGIVACKRCLQSPNAGVGGHVILGIREDKSKGQTFGIPTSIDFINRAWLRILISESSSTDIISMGERNQVRYGETFIKLAWVALRVGPNITWPTESLKDQLEDSLKGTYEQ